VFILSHPVQLFRGLPTALCTLVFPDGADNSRKKDRKKIQFTGSPLQV